MARRRRRQPAAYDLAEALTSLWAVWFCLTVLLPVSLLHTAPSAATVRLLVVAAMPVALSWWWLIRTLRQRRARGKRLDELLAMPPAVFEDWVGARFRDLGYTVEMTGAQGDHGIDLVCTKPTQKAVVQVKKYKDWAVGEPTLRDLYGAMHAAGAERAYLVTTGRLTEPARAWTEGKPIEVWDGETVAQISLGADAGQRPAAVSAASVQSCPRCGSALVRRVNSRTREPFYGCSAFPKCRFTTPAKVSN